MAYREVEDIRRILAFGKVLNKVLKTSSIRQENRTVGYPGGHQRRTVYFLNDEHTDTLWYSGWESSKRCPDT